MAAMSNTGRYQDNFYWPQCHLRREHLDVVYKYHFATVEHRAIHDQVTFYQQKSAEARTQFCLAPDLASKLGE